MGGETEAIGAIIRGLTALFTAPNEVIQHYTDRILYYALIIFFLRWLWLWINKK
jgi:hypothetical protein